jgi:hypothetical protein
MRTTICSYFVRDAAIPNCARNPLSFRGLLVMIMSIAKTVVMPRERIVSAAAQSDEENRLNYALRPQKFDQ